MTEPTWKPTPIESLLVSDIPEPEWAIKGWWTHGAHGIIGGPPDSYKSTLAVEMALSLATGVPFLGHYEVTRYASDGHVLIVQEENSLASLRRMVARICAARGLGDLHERDHGMWEFVHRRGTNLNVSHLSLERFDLTDQVQVKRLGDFCNRKQVRYVFFDPVYLMIGDSDENSGRDLRKVLLALTWLKEETGAASILVHHTGKATDRRGGRALLGHTYLHGWMADGMFPTVSNGVVTVEHKMREMPRPEPDVLMIDPTTWKWTPVSGQHNALGRHDPKMTKASHRLKTIRTLLDDNPEAEAQVLAITESKAARAKKLREVIGNGPWGNVGDKTVERDLANLGMWDGQE